MQPPSSLSCTGFPGVLSDGGLRSFVRIYDQVLGDPLPAELLRLVARLETSTNPCEHRMAA
jgi:hypothetical protein